jgi:cytochrome c biogenesis factor
MKKAGAIIVFLIFVILIASDTSLAQCAMCKESVANSEEAAALSSRVNLAVAVLLLPAVAMFVGLFGVIYRYRNPQHCPQER